MKLNQKQWIATAVAVFVVGFFFVFGQNILTFFNHAGINSTTNNMNTAQSQLGIQDVIVGQGDTALSGDQITVNYIGKLSNGTVFDSSVARKEPFQFVLGNGQVIAGWDKGIVGMQVGGTRILTIPPELGYGPNTYGPIPGGSTLIFEVQLLKVIKQ